MKFQMKQGLIWIPVSISYEKKEI